MKNLRTELMNGVGRYGENHIDLVVDKESNIVYGTYHSERDSFPVTNNYNLLAEKDIKRLCNELDIGYFEV